MKNPPPSILNAQDKSSIEDFPIKEFFLTRAVNFLLGHLSAFFRSISFSKISSLFEKIKTLGNSPELEE
jgi:hypothetical protein